MRDLLVRAAAITPLGLNWDVRRLDGRYFYHAEPVCTHPDHRRKGLAQALMQEGLLRLRDLGALEASVDTGNMLPANRFYDSIGFTEAYRGYAWRKVWQARS